MRVLLLALVCVAVLVTNTSAAPDPNTRHDRLPVDQTDANKFVEEVLSEVNEKVVSRGLDPAPLQVDDMTPDDVHVTFYDGEVVGLSKMKRSGNSTLGKEDGLEVLNALFSTILKVNMKGNATKDSTTSVINISGDLGGVPMYTSFTKNLTSGDVELRSSEISIDYYELDIQGLGPFQYINDTLTFPLQTEISFAIFDIFDDQIRDVIIQDVLESVTWPTV